MMYRAEKGCQRGRKAAGSCHKVGLRNSAHMVKHVFLGVFLVVFSPGVAAPQDGPIGSSPRILYQNASLGFRYLQPIELEDTTERSKARVQAFAAEQHMSRALGLLLTMSSGPDNDMPGWHSLAIETYPRQAVADLDDPGAEAKMSGWVAGYKRFARNASFCIDFATKVCRIRIWRTRGHYKEGCRRMDYNPQGQAPVIRLCGQLA